MSDLYLFPEIPGEDNGYRIAVNWDFLNCCFNKNDVVIFWTTKENIRDERYGKFLKELGVHYFFVRRNVEFKKKFIELIHLNHPAYFSKRNISSIDLLKKKFKNVYCGDIVFYNFVKKHIDTNNIIVRFHNLWTKNLIRKKLYNVNIDTKYYFNLLFASKIENIIFKDNSSYKIFITNSDNKYYQSITGKNDSSVFPVLSIIYKEPELTFKDNKGKFIIDNYLHFIWFGSVSTHVKFSIAWFIQDVYMKLIREGYKVKFSLYGIGTDKFNNDKLNIKSYGFVENSIIPNNGNGIFINPDLTGGGIKLKVDFFLKNQLYFISTPFGMDGYESCLEYKNVISAEPLEWIDKIKQIL